MELQISLPTELQQKIEEEAAALGVSVEAFVCDSLQWAIVKKPHLDPFFADDTLIDDDGPTDMAANHDEYLYGDGANP